MYDWNLLNSMCFCFMNMRIERSLICGCDFCRWKGLGSISRQCTFSYHRLVFRPSDLHLAMVFTGPEPDPLSNPEHGPGSGSSAGYGAPSSRRSTTRVASWWTGRCTTVTRTREAWFQASCRSRDSWRNGIPRTTHTQCVRRRSRRRAHRHHATPGQPAAEHPTSVRQSRPRFVRAGTNGRRVLCNTAAIRSRIANGVERRCGPASAEQCPCDGRRGRRRERR